MKVDKFLISAVIVVAISVPAFSQSDSLFHYLELASRNNPTVLQRFSEYEAALEKIPQAGALPDPEVSAGILLSPMELVMGKQVADFQLMQMFPWFGTLKAAKDEMSLMAKAKFEIFRDAKLQVFYDVQRTWYELQKINQNIRIAEKNLDILNALERIALVRFKTSSPGTNGSMNSSSGTSGSQMNTMSQSGSVSGGMQGMGNNTYGTSGNRVPSTSGQNSTMSSAGTGLSDLYRIQIEISDMENNIALMKDQLKTILARFNGYLNRPVTSPVALTDTLTVDSLGIPLTSVTDSMMMNHPMLDMLEYEKQSVEARKKMVTRMGYPGFGIGLDYSLLNKSEMSTSSMNGKDMIMPMVKIMVPLNRKKYKSMQKEADLLKTATELNYEATANSLQTEFYEAVQLYEDAKRRIVLYKDQSDLANQSLDILTRSFSASGSGLTDILQIRRQTYDYEYRQIEAVADLNISIAWLKRLGNI